MPHDDDAARLARCTYQFGEFCSTFDIDVPALHRKAVMWGHCYHRATGGINPEEQVLTKMGLDVDPVRAAVAG